MDEQVKIPETATTTKDRKTTLKMSRRTQYSTLMIVTCGLLMALHVVLSIFVTLKSETMKIGFAFIATFMAAFIYGPAAGAIVGGGGDVLQAIIKPAGPFNPAFTLTAALAGAVLGALLYRKQSRARVLIAVGINEFIIGLVINTWLIHHFYGAPVKALLEIRVVQAVVLFIVESVIMIVFIEKLLPRVKAKQMAAADRLSKKAMARRELRKAKIAARDALSQEERAGYSASISERILSSREFRDAAIIMIYKGIRGEVRLGALENRVEEMNRQALAEGRPLKKLAYPLCISDTEMIPLVPSGEDAWAVGYQGITEPVKEKSVEIDPKDIDLIVCPMAVFDSERNRMGMGGGFYDRFIPKAVNAKIVGVAFECQKAAEGEILTEAWDKPMEAVFTEEREYR